MKGHVGAPAVGVTLDSRYTLERVLGSGAMGTVYAAKTTEGADVAIKTLLAAPAHGDRDERRTRFLREAALSATIDHPNVVPVVGHGIDELTGIPYLAMPLLVGEDLDACLHRVGCLEPGVAIAIVVQACAGLAAVHACGIVHRDVKPSNLFLETRGSEIVVRVTDFGLAKAFGTTPDKGALTATGRFMGTPQYVSPEQAISAKHVDVRSDVYSLSMSLYHALSGAPAFAHASSFMHLVLELTSREAPALQDSAPWVDPKVARIVHAGLLREPRCRCPTVDEFALALDTAVGIDESRRTLSRNRLLPPEGPQRQIRTARATLATSWDEILRS